MTAFYQNSQWWEEMSCGACGINFCVPSHFHKECKEKGSKRTWYCPSGHPRIFGESKSDEIQRELDRARQKIAQVEDEKREAVAAAEARARAAESKTKRVTKRAHAGMCQCCNRSFSNVAQHMADKHPEIAVLKIPATKRPKRKAA